MSAPAETRRHGAAPSATDELKALRAQLDRIDESLLAGLRERMACSAEIARVKWRHGIPIRQVRRAGVVHERAVRFGAENGVDVRFVQQVYALIIAESCRVQHLIVRSSGGPPAQ